MKIRPILYCVLYTCCVYQTLVGCVLVIALFLHFTPLFISVRGGFDFPVIFLANFGFSLVNTTILKG